MRTPSNAKKAFSRLLRKEAAPDLQKDQVRIVELANRRRSGSYVNLFTAAACGYGGNWFVFSILGDAKPKSPLGTTGKSEKPGVMVRKLSGVRLAQLKEHISLKAKAGTLCCVLSPRILASAAKAQKTGIRP